MRGGVLQLRAGACSPRCVAAGTPPVRRTTFHYGDEAIAVAIDAAATASTRSMRRAAPCSTALLVDAAREAGAEVRHGQRLTRRAARAGRARRGRRRARRADGRRARSRPGWWSAPTASARASRGSPARAGAASRPQRQPRRSTATGRGLGDRRLPLALRAGRGGRRDPDQRRRRTASSPRSPRRRFRDEIAVATSPPGSARVLAEVAPALAASASPRARLESLRGFAGRPGFLRQAWGPGWALVGDAGYFKDPITAHGITDALRDAELLARAVARRHRDARSPTTRPGATRWRCRCSTSRTPSPASTGRSIASRSCTTSAPRR